MKHQVSNMVCIAGLVAALIGGATVLMSNITRPKAIDSNREARYLLCDHHQAILQGVWFRVENQRQQTDYDGMVYIEFPDGKDSVQAMLWGEDIDTTYVMLRREDIGKQRMLTVNIRKSSDDGMVVACGVSAVSAKASKVKKSKTPAPALVMEEEEPVMELDVVEDAKEVFYLDLADEKKLSGVSKAHSNSQAGTLTAGEVNDFAKWSFWDKLASEKYKEHVAKWGLHAQKRYRVLLENEQGAPMVDASVELINKSGKVIFAGKTDNTGHAELWADFQNTKSEPKSIRCTYKGQTKSLNNPKAWPKLNTLQLSSACEAPEAVDVFFVVDATGSMSDEIRYLKAEMQDVISRSENAVKGTTIRTGALVYRDHGDSYLTRISPLSDSISTTQTFIDKQEAAGGGDYEEAIPEALYAAVDAADWSKEARARIVFLVLDAPCHKDHSAKLKQTIESAARQGIRIVPIVCSGLREDGEVLMREIALLTNGTSFFLTDDSGVGNPHHKPTTDKPLKVEHLNDMMVRTIIEFATVPECQEQWAEEATEEQETDQFVPNPFELDDLDEQPTILPELPIEEAITVRPNPCQEYCLVDLPSGADALFVSDLSGKTLMSLGQQPKQTSGLQIEMGSLPRGIYFVKAWIGGKWYSKKVIKG